MTHCGGDIWARARREHSMLRGFSQLIFFADDMAAARRWYTELLGMEPYFERLGPDGRLAYMDSRVGDQQHEWGVSERECAPDGSAGGPAGAVAKLDIDAVE